MHGYFSTNHLLHEGHVVSYLSRQHTYLCRQKLHHLSLYRDSKKDISQLLFSSKKKICLQSSMSLQYIFLGEKQLLGDNSLSFRQTTTKDLIYHSTL